MIRGATKHINLVTISGETLIIPRNDRREIIEPLMVPKSDHHKFFDYIDDYAELGRKIIYYLQVIDLRHTWEREILRRQTFISPGFHNRSSRLL